MYPDTAKTATMFSGLAQVRYEFLKKFSISGRYEFFNDYDGFLSGPYTYNGITRGLLTQGFSVSFEYKPIKIGYIRLEYRCLFAAPGNKVFFSNTSDQMQALIFTTGVRF